MALLPPVFVEATVVIGRPGDSETEWIATGFIVGWSFSYGNHDLVRTYLVTNRHVVNGLSKLVVRISSSGGSRQFVADLVDEDGTQYVWGPPDPRADVVVIPVNGDVVKESGLTLRYFLSPDAVLTREQMDDEGVALGDAVFLLGFPLGLAGISRNTVIVRGGVIASLEHPRDEGVGSFLIDANNFPGNSGGPVVLQPQTAALRETKAIDRAYLIGVVTGYLPFIDTAVSQQTGRPRITFEENSGLAVLEPVDAILAAIDAHVASMSTEDVEKAIHAYTATLDDQDDGEQQRG